MYCLAMLPVPSLITFSMGTHCSFFAFVHSQISLHQEDVVQITKSLVSCSQKPAIPTPFNPTHPISHYLCWDNLGFANSIKLAHAAN